MLGDEDLVFIFRRKHRTRVKSHAHRGDGRTELLRRRGKFTAGMFLAELRIGDIAAMAVGVAEMQPRLGRMIQFIRRRVVSLPIPAVVGEPKLLGLWMPIKTDRIANAAGKHFDTAAV